MSDPGEMPLAADGGARPGARCGDQRPGPVAAHPLRLLLFSVGGVRFGIDADQVAGIAAYQGEQDGDLCWFHEALDFGGRSVGYRSPTVATIRTQTAQPCRMIIDALEDLCEISAEAIAPFPPVLEPLFLPWGLWGIWLRQEQMIFLLDVQWLLREKSSRLHLETER